MKKRNSNTCDGFIFQNNSNHSLLKRNVLKTTILTFFGKPNSVVTPHPDVFKGKLMQI